jgi:rhodanese-related sulfurtransferase
MKKLRKLIPALISATLLTSCAHSVSSSAGYKQIGMTEAAEIMKTHTDFILLDVRRPDEFSENRIPGAINVPNEEIGTSDIDELPRKDQLILVYCRSGRRSKIAAEELVKLGYTNVKEFDGIIDWEYEIVK